MAAARRAAAAALLCFLSAVPGSSAGSVSFRGAGQVAEDEVKRTLIADLRDAARLQPLEQALAQMYTSLPKNSHGNLGHQAVRYALHRYFVNRHGWFIRGLEPGGAAWNPAKWSNYTKGSIKEWVPNFLQETLENRLGPRGAGLRDLAALAAALEDLVQKEARVRLTMAYDANDLAAEGPVTRTEAEDVLSTYFLSFLLANNFSVATKSELLRKREVFARKYKGYAEANQWFGDVVSKTLGAESGPEGVRFGDAAKVVYHIGEEYHSFNDQDCKSLRSTLRGLEGRRAGRVRLSTFYNMSLYSHWRFTEKAEYLRALGALDESDPKQPAVIIPNYAMARPNCLDSSNLYAICCRNACEDLMTHLEQKIGTHEAPARRIEALVSALPSETVAAPRDLPPSLLVRLDEIAAHNGGQVPLHGRLFAQWMHHAYPLECPYPHERGTVNPQTPDEWIEETGSASKQATAEEMRLQVESDVCAINSQGKPECGEDSADLPWSAKEELLTSHAGGHEGRSGRGEAPRGHASGLQKAILVVLALLSLAAASALGAKTLAGVRARRASPGAVAQALILAALSHRHFTAVAVSVLVALAYALDLLDGTVFAYALGCSLVLLAARAAAARLEGRAAASGKALEGKCCV